MKENNKYTTLKHIIEVLPNKPGVYQYFDKEGKILYVGKARDLKKRVSSYFSGSASRGFKQSVLVKKIDSIKHIVVENEQDALLLENNLIKNLQPRYNVLLKDDKTFPWICIKNEPFPRVFYTRNVIRDGSIYYGPYTSVVMVKTMLELTRQLFPLRNCKHKLTGENIEAGKFKVCLEHHLGNCLAPCVGLEGEEDYMKSIEQVKNIMKGNIREVSSYLRGLMKNYAEEFKYEEAQALKEKLGIIEKYRSKSTIVNPRIKNLDVYSIVEEEEYSYVNFLRVIDGAVVHSHTLEMKKKLDESAGELLSLAIVDIRQKIRSDASEIIVPVIPEMSLENIRFIVPQRGDKKQLLDLSERNAKHYRIEKKKKQESYKKATNAERILDTVKKDLRLKKTPVHIECFDNSNLQGTNPVAACIVFRNAVPSKKDYRHYHIKSVSGPDDFASMEEIVFRRYKRLIDEKTSLPGLIVIDGGKGQLNAAVRSMEKLGLRGRIAIVGVAKRLEEIYFPGDKVPLYIDKNSETLRLIQNLRNEAHRFGIEFHRRQREKSLTVSELDSIKGIGEKTKADLLKEFSSVEEIRKAEKKDLSRVVGPARADLIRNYFLRSTT